MKTNQQTRLVAWFNTKEKDQYYVVIEGRKNINHAWGDTPFIDDTSLGTTSRFNPEFVMSLQKTALLQEKTWRFEDRSERLIVSFRNAKRNTDECAKAKMERNDIEFTRIIKEAVGSMNEDVLNLVEIVIVD